MQMTTGELIDRYAIEFRKNLYGSTNEDFLAAMRKELPEGAYLSAELGVLNAEIANLEWVIREAKNLSTEEIGRRARAIRRLNSKRVDAKNAISVSLGEKTYPGRFDTPAVTVDECAQYFQEPADTMPSLGPTTERQGKSVSKSRR